MHPVRAIAIGLLAWPAAEIVAFFCVWAAVGFFNAILLIAILSFAGLFVLRHFSNGPQRFRTPDGFITAASWNGGMAPGLSGFLLLIPGFLSSALGILVLFPISRRWLLAGFHHLVAPRPQRPPADPGVVDLAPDEWRSLPGEKLPPSEQAGRK